MGNSILSKGVKGYGYNYTELAQINKYLADMGLSYYQFIEAEGESERIYTVKVDENGKESAPVRGCKVITGAMVNKEGKPTANKVQDYGAALTYARRYSLMMAYGLSTTDTDGLTDEEIRQKEEQKKNPKAKKPTPKKEEPKPQKAVERYPKTEERMDMIDELLFYAEQLGSSEADVCKLCKVSSLDEMSNDRLENGIKLYRARVEEVIAKEKAEKNGGQQTMVIGG